MDRNINLVRSILYTIADDIQQSLKEWKEKNKDIKKVQIYDDLTATSKKFPIEVRRKYKSSEKFKCFVKILNDIYKDKEYIKYIDFDKLLEDFITESIYVDKEELSDNFIKRLEGKNIKYKASIILQNVSSNENEIKISENIVIRKTNFNPKIIEDLYQECSKYLSPDILSIAHKYINQISSSTSYEIEIESSTLSVDNYDDEIIKTELFRFLQALRLYKLGAVYLTVGKLTILDDKSSHSTPSIFLDNYYSEDVQTPIYHINKEDGKRLMEFYNKIKDKIPIYVFKNPDLSNPIGRAIGEYNDALLRHDLIEDRITSAVFGLETLYSLGKEEGKKKKVIRKRIRKVLSIANKNFTRSSIKKYISKAYGIRNAYAHGETLIPDNDKSIEEIGKLTKLLLRLLEYLRESILIFMQVPLDKNKFLKLIDKDKEYENEIRRLLSNVDLGEINDNILQI